MGMGKTVSVLTHLAYDYEFMGCSCPTLVLAPLRVAQYTWPGEVTKWDHLKHLSIVAIVGSEEERSQRLAWALGSGHVQVVCINYENLPWLAKWLAARRKAWPFRRVVADESTRLKNFRTKQGGTRAHALAPVAHRDVKRWINLTGTPSPNGLKDLWGQQWFIEGGARLGLTYAAFEERWFGYRRVQDAVNRKVEIQPVIFPYAQEQIQQRMADCSLALDPKDWFDLDEIIVKTVPVKLPVKARRVYRDLEKEMFAHLDAGKTVEIVNAATLTMKCLQVANGAVYLDAEEHGKGAHVELHEAKLEALDSIYQEAAGAPLLVVYQWKTDLDRILRAFPKARSLVGKDSGQTMADWNEGKVPMLVVHPASAGHGLNLQDGGNTVVFFGQWWDLEQHDQVIERIGPMRQKQSGHNRPVFAYYIVAEDTIDEAVIARRASKAGVQDTLMEYAKRRG
jgi:SNF2 family DNA or RNA helicase